MKKILVADDELEALSILERGFTMHNYQVKTASSASAVIESVKSDKPDLMLLDIVMPDMDGYTLLGTLRQEKEFSEIPVIFVTGKELLPQGIEKRMEELGVSGYLMKPCTFDDILAKVRSVIGE